MRTVQDQRVSNRREVTEIAGSLRRLGDRLADLTTKIRAAAKEANTLAGCLEDDIVPYVGCTDAEVVANLVEPQAD